MYVYGRPDPYPPTLTTHKKGRRKPKDSKEEVGGAAVAPRRGLQLNKYNVPKLFIKNGRRDVKHRFREL